jgi:hypothetical protein
MQEGSTPSGASCLADDLLLHTEGPDAVPAMNIMVNAIAPILKWTGLEVHMIKSQCTGINHATGIQVATDSITLNGQSFTTLPPDKPYKYLGVRATISGDLSAEKEYILDEMKQRLAALSEDRVLSRKDKEQIIVTAVCSVFRYSAGLVNWSRTELDSISKTWTRAYKTAWGFSRGTDGSPFILDQCAGGRGCPSATKMWAREILDMYEQCLTLPGEISQMVVQYLRQQCTSHGCHTLNQLQYLLQISENTETVLELFLLRLNEQGLEISSPWESDHDESLIEVLWPRLHGAWLEKSRWAGCRELDASVHATWVAAKNCLHACKKLGNAKPPILAVNQFRGSQTRWLHVSELKKRQCHLSLEEYTTLTSWLPSSVLPPEKQSRPNSESAHPSSVIVPTASRGPILLPPCIAGQVIKTGEHNCLVLESLTLHNIPDETSRASQTSN